MVKAAGIQWNNGEDDIVAIWPKGGRRGGAVPLIKHLRRRQRHLRRRLRLRQDLKTG